jgi:hypothetical protein
MPENRMSSRTSRRSIALRYYLWADDQAYRIPNKLHSMLLDGEVRLLRYAETAQRIIEASINRRVGKLPQVKLRYTTYVFDKDGFFDLVDQADAVQGTFGSKTSGNIVDVRDVLAGRRWNEAHHWNAPQSAVEQVIADIQPEKRMENYKPLPVLSFNAKPSEAPSDTRN